MKTHLLVTWLLPTVAAIPFMCSCNEDVRSATPDIGKQQISSPDVEADIDSFATATEAQIFPMLRESNGDNKMTIGLDVLENAGDVVINTQRISTVIIGNQRWTLDDYNQPIDLPEGFDEWSAPEIHRWQQGEKFTLSKHIRATISKRRTNFYLYSLAMLLDRQIVDDHLVDEDRLNTKYEAVDEFHIPSNDESCIMRTNLRWHEAIKLLNLKATGHFIHQYGHRDSIKVNGTWVKTTHLTDEKFGTDCAYFWNRDYIPNRRGGQGPGPYGTWYIDVTSTTNGNHYYSAQHQDLEPLLPIRLVQTVRKK